MLLVLDQDTFTQYSTAWFIWTDFIPRGLACLTLVFLMFYKPIKLQIPTFSARDKSGDLTSEGSAQQGESSNSRPNYRDHVEEEGDQFTYDSENPMQRTASVNYGKRSSIEMKTSSVTGPTLMTDFFRPSEDFDLELNKAMDSA